MNDPSAAHPVAPSLPRPFAIVGAGRLGSAIAGALRTAGVTITGPHGRGYPGRAADGTPDEVVLLCVPDDAIADAASAVVRGPMLGHCSGVSTLDVLGGREGFSVHPLLTVTGPDTDFRDAWAAVAGTTAPAIQVAEQLARALGLKSVRVADADRPAYHAAASIAANFLVTLESAAAQLLASAGLDRAVLLPLARAALENWGNIGPAALTGPVARGDVGTVARHREVVRVRTPELTELFDVLVSATERLVIDTKGSVATDNVADQVGATHLLVTGTQVNTAANSTAGRLNTTKPQTADPRGTAAAAVSAAEQLHAHLSAGEGIQSETNSAEHGSSGVHRSAGEQPAAVDQPADDVEPTTR